MSEEPTNAEGSPAQPGKAIEGVTLASSGRRKRSWEPDMICARAASRDQIFYVPE